MSATQFVAARVPLELYGVRYPVGVRVDAKALRSLKRASLQYLLQTGRVVEIEDGEALAPGLSAARVNVRAKA